MGLLVQVKVSELQRTRQALGKHAHQQPFQQRLYSVTQVQNEMNTASKPKL